MPRLTPAVPHEFRDFRLAGYRNIYELLPNESKVYGTETMYPDWSAPVLLLAKDFAASRVVMARIARGETNPYRHADPQRGDREGVVTNTRIRRFVDTALGAKFPLLYGSAYAGLLRDDGAMSGAHKQNGDLGLVYGARVLRWVIDQMTEIRAIACLGPEAWRCAHIALGARTLADFRQARDNLRPLMLKELTLFAHYHPAARRLSDETRLASWRAMADHLRTDQRIAALMDAA